MDKVDVKELMSAFEEFKQANDENEKKRDSLLEVKIHNITKKLDSFEPLNQKLTLAEQQNKAMQEQLDRVETILNRPGVLGANDKGEQRKVIAAFDRVIRRQPDERDPADVALIKQYSAALVRSEDTAGGYLLAPPEMQADIIKDVIEISPLRALATVRTIGTGSLKQRKRTGTGSATRVGETQSRVNTGDPAYGMIEIQAPEMFARMEISQQMLEDSEYDLLAELREDSSEQFAVKEGVEFIGGAGASNQAEGILTNADVGIVVSGNASLITADGLQDLYYGLKTAHSRNATFGLNRNSIGKIRKLKDGQGNYMWIPGIAGNVPNTILNAPYVEMPDMPDAAANTFPVVFGDFRKAYLIVDRVSIAFQVDYTTGADDGLVVFRARKRTGGGVRQAEAIKKLKCAAS
ncbi:MAG TPA: phage major capsid protein [Burkholderiales bacterium]|jgi:HK97 family phage major capsid protein|nr:phage major capsid protein [Burkholderiales bacterium]